MKNIKTHAQYFFLLWDISCLSEIICNCTRFKHDFYCEINLFQILLKKGERNLCEIVRKNLKLNNQKYASSFYYDF